MTDPRSPADARTYHDDLTLPLVIDPQHDRAPSVGR